MIGVTVPGTGRGWLILVAMIGAVALICLGAGGAWLWQSNAWQARLAAQASLHQADLTVIANAGAAQARRALEEQQRAEKALADLDTRNLKERADGLAENERLRAAVADGTSRLRIAGSCNTSSGSMPGATSAAGMGNAGSVELAPVAGQNVLDIRAGIIADQSALKALQAYVNNVCLRAR